MRNRLLNYVTSSGVRLEVPPGTLAALEDTVTDGGAITLLPADQVGGVQEQRGVQFGRDLTEGQRADLLTSRRSVYCDVPSDAYDTRMRRLVYRVRTVAEETGANTLYLALGSLVWRLDDQQLRSPLVLVPVRLTTRARHGAYRIELDEAGTSTPNYCLLEKLRQVHGLTVPGLAEPVTDASGIDLDAAFRALRTALADADLPYRVEQTADLAVLAFAKFRLWKDLDDAWEELTQSPLVAHLATTPTEPFVDPAAGSANADLDDLATRCPDPRRRVPIGRHRGRHGRADVRAGGSAGHRQVSDHHQRAGSCHGIRATGAVRRGEAGSARRRDPAVERDRPRPVLPGPARQGRQTGDGAGRRPDGVGCPPGRRPPRSGGRDRTHAIRRGQLGRYATRLHDRNGAGLSFYSAHTQSLTVGNGPSLPVPDAAVATGAGLTEVRRALVTLPDAADPARPRPGHPWGFVDPPDPAGADPDAIAAAVAELTVELSGWWAASPIAEAVEAARRPSDLSALAMFAGTWAQDLGLIDDAASARWHAAADAARVRADEFAGARHPGLDVVRPEVLGLPLEEIDRDARAAAASSWFGRKKRQLAVVARFDGFVRDGAAIARKEVADLTGELVRTWNDLIQLQVQVSAVPGLTTTPGWNPLLPADRAVAGRPDLLVGLGGRDRQPPGPHRTDDREPRAVPGGAARLLESRAVISDAERESLDRLASAAARVAVLTGGDDPIAAWTGEGSAGLAAMWERTGPGRAADPAALRRRLALVAHLQPLRTAGLTQAREMLLVGAVPAADAARAFDAGVAATSLRERAAATGLGGFDPVAHDGSVATFVSSADRVRDQLVTAIPAGADPASAPSTRRPATAESASSPVSWPNSGAAWPSVD